MNLKKSLLFFCSLLIFYSCKKSPSISFEVIGSNSIGDTTTLVNNSENCDEYYWDFGDGFGSNDVNPKHVYTKIGEYNIILLGIKDDKVDKQEKRVSIKVDSEQLAGTYNWTVTKNEWHGNTGTTEDLPNETFSIIIIDDTTISIKNKILKFKGLSGNTNLAYRSDAAYQMNHGESLSYDKRDKTLFYQESSGGLGGGTNYWYYSVKQ